MHGPHSNWPTVLFWQAPRLLLRTQEECQDLEPEADGAVSRAVGDEMPGTYINFYMANGSESEKGGIILPQFGDVERDAMAVQMFTEQFPNREIVPVMSRDILCGGGNIHCITQQQPKGE